MLSHDGWKARVLPVLIVALVAAALVGGCGGDDGDSGTTGGGSATGEGAATGGGSDAAPGVAEAEAATKPLLERPTEIAVTKPIDKPIPKGKRIALMQCGFPGCIPLGDHVKAAGESLGWTVQRYNTGLTPESVKTEWQKVVRDKPDGVVAMVYPSAIFKSELAQLDKEGIPVATCCTPEGAINGIDLMVNALENGKVIGKAMANYVVGSRKGDVHPLAVDIGGNPIAQTVNVAFKEELKRLAPDVQVDDLVVPATSIGKDAPSRIVGYLRSHPDVDLIVLSQVDPAIGLPAALKAAGLDIPIFGEGGNPTIDEYIRSGQMEGTVAFDDYGVGYTMVDGLARHFAGGDIQDSNVNMPRWVITPDNVPDGDTFPVVEDNDEQFKALWGVN